MTGQPSPDPVRPQPSHEQTAPETPSKLKNRPKSPVFPQPASDKELRADVLCQGIAARTFVRSFQLADHVGVKAATLDNGLLSVGLLREFSEAMKPRVIPIASLSKLPEANPIAIAA
jgi:hypothetical protein